MGLQKKIHESEELAVGIVDLVEQSHVIVKTSQGEFSLDITQANESNSNLLEKGDQLTVVFSKETKQPVELRNKEKHILYVDEQYKALHYTK